MKDRFTAGFSAGIIAAIFTNAASFAESMMQLTSLRTADLISLIIYAHEPPFSLPEIAVGLFFHVFVCGVIGAMFALLVPQIKSRMLWLKGWLYSEAFWFFVYGITALFQVPGTVPTPLKTIICDTVNAAIYGVALAIALTALSRAKAPSSSVVQASMSPAMKPLDETDKNNDQ